MQSGSLGTYRAALKVPHRRRDPPGFTYVWMLAALAVFSLGLAVVGPRWADDVQRTREQELLRIGALYAKAIAAYRAASPGSLKQYPAELDNLLIDQRMVGTLRHLRQLYPDPFDPARPWGLVYGADGSIRGIYSQSTQQPLRSVPVELDEVSLPAARQYSDWKFIPRTSQ